MKDCISTHSNPYLIEEEALEWLKKECVTGPNSIHVYDLERNLIYQAEVNEDEKTIEGWYISENNKVKTFLEIIKEGIS